MQSILIRLSRQVKRRLRRTVGRIQDAQLKTRYLIVLHSAEGVSYRVIREMLGCSSSTITRVRQRFLQEGEAGLQDRRGDNGQAKVDEKYILKLLKAVAASPHEYGYPRPSWTLELLVKVLDEQTGIRISCSRMCRILKALGVRRGMPKPIVGCPWSSRARKRRIGLIEALERGLGPDEALLHEDEVDIHLNPKIGPDYMLKGQQKQVLTPGQNVKRYLAGALDIRTGRIVWVEGTRKRSALFVALLQKLLASYKDKRRIHVVLDNYCIHTSKITQKALAGFDGKIVLHFLPPYCPDDNKIERRVWRELHANVTRNHRCASINELMRAVRRYLWQRNLKAAAQRRRKAA
jgi:transposase